MGKMTDFNSSFQPLLDRLTHTMIKSSMMRKFMKLKNSKEKLKFFYVTEEIQYDGGTYINIRKEISDLLQAFYLSSGKHSKSVKVAEEMKHRGSKAFLKKQDDDAVKLYTDGLRFAPEGSQIAAFLYANRSAAHSQTKNYKECLKDIERAERAGYPPERQFKLYRRKIEALVMLGKKKEAESVLQLAEKVVVAPDKDSLRCLERKISQLGLEDSVPSCVSSVCPLPDLFGGNNDKEISPALEIRVNSADGRHVCAVSDIPKGVVLFREKPFAAILLPEYFLSRCQRCFSSLVNPLPCVNCCDVLWCGEQCREKGQLYHAHECGNLHIFSGVGIAHLALRIILVAGWPLCRQVREESEREEIPFKSLYAKDKRSRYKAVFSLVNHFSKASPDEQFQYSLAAIILAKVLIEKSDFLSPGKECVTTADRNEIEVEFSSILVHHIAQLVSNAHAITQLEDSDQGNTNLSQIAQKRVASAIYPLASLMNHSCNPSIINSFHGDVLVIHSTGDIKSGDQLYNCYGPHASRLERKERQTALERQYFFHCKCDACTDDGRLLQEASWSGLKCPNCRGIAVTLDGDPKSSSESETFSFRCFECNSKEEVPPDLIQKCSNVNNLFEDGQKSLKSGLLEQAERECVEALKLAEQVFTKDNEFLNLIRDTVAKIYTITGSYGKALDQLSLCLRIVESRFGESSVEAAHELIKYFDVSRLAATSAAELQTSERIKKRIDEIFTVHYGSSWQKYLKLQFF